MARGWPSLVFALWVLGSGAPLPGPGNLLPACAAEAWKPPEQPKDDEHWYPERPVREEPAETLENGSFEEESAPVPGRPAGPRGWAAPDGLTSLWTTDPGAPGHGKVLVLDTDVYERQAKERQAALRKATERKEDPPAAPAKTKVPKEDQYAAIGATYGVSFYSVNFKCKPQQAYKLAFDFKGPEGAKVWVRGWGPFQDQLRRRWETFVNCRTAGEGWRHFEQPFHPTRRPLSKGQVRYEEIAYLQVMLYAYWPRGLYSFDNLRIEEIGPEEYERLKEKRAEPK